jgi:hypothetical protein
LTWTFFFFFFILCPSVAINGQITKGEGRTKWREESWDFGIYIQGDDMQGERGDKKEEDRENQQPISSVQLW